LDGHRRKLRRAQRARRYLSANLQNEQSGWVLEPIDYDYEHEQREYEHDAIAGI